MIKIDQLKTDIENKGFISSIYYFDETDSTNSFASKDEIPVDSLVIAEHQSSGKGRMNRNWVSEKNLNLTFSIKKNLPLPYSMNHISVFYFSYSVYSALKEFLSGFLLERDLDCLQIKWPNDILFNWKKLSGILIETKLPGNKYVMGCGINCNQEKFPDELNAVSLKNIMHKEVDLNTIVKRIIKTLDLNFRLIKEENFIEIFNKWKQSSKLIGKTCKFSNDFGILRYGKISNLNFDGSIEIISNDIIEKYYSGEIKILSFS